MKTTGHEKDHFTVVLTARADGKKMKPYIVFKGKGTRLIKQLQSIPDVVVAFSSNGWMNDTLTTDYLKKIIGQLSSANVFSFGMLTSATLVKLPKQNLVG